MTTKIHFWTHRPHIYIYAQNRITTYNHIPHFDWIYIRIESLQYLFQFFLKNLHIPTNRYCHSCIIQSRKFCVCLCALNYPLQNSSYKFNEILNKNYEIVCKFSVLIKTWNLDNNQYFNLIAIAFKLENKRHKVRKCCGQQWKFRRA